MRGVKPRIFAFFFAAVLSLFLAGPWRAHSQEEESPPPWPVLTPVETPEPLPGTAPLTWEDDIASRLVTGVDRFLLDQIEAARQTRDPYWHRDFASPEAYSQSVEPNRSRLRDMLGLRDTRAEAPVFQFHGASPGGSLIAEGNGYSVHAVSWKAFGDVTGAGLLVLPKGKAVANVVAIPDADVTPEQLLGLEPHPGLSLPERYGRHLAASGCRVLVPLLISREEAPYKMTWREWLYRPAYELGRHLIGYEIEKVQSGIDCLNALDPDTPTKTGLFGWGEGALLALYTAALDERVDAAGVSGYFGSRQNLWQETAERNVFGLLREFGDAEVASLIAPRTLVIQNAPGPEFAFPPGKNGKPGRITSPTDQEAKGEAERARRLVEPLGLNFPTFFDHRPPKYEETLTAFLQALAPEATLAYPGEGAKSVGPLPDAAARHASQVHEIDRHNQWVLRESEQTRKAFMKDLDFSSLDAYQKSSEIYRAIFRDEVVGHFDLERLPFNARSRAYQEGPKTLSYEVVLDVFPDVFAYGILTLPKNLKDGEKRPVVVCQHGLEGRPQDVIGEARYAGYKAFATELAERGFITFAPQNLYLFGDRFRTLQFKSNTIGRTLFSTIVPQHQQITDWLAEQPFVDAEHIGFYGLSYGGKSAMRIPPLVDRYALSICSADFNDWVWKTAATDERSLRYSYANKKEYEIFEFNLGGTFNYAEMAALIAPRPFMVERGHFDGVAPDETVAYEFAKIRFLYEAQLGLENQAGIEWFTGPHSIHGEGTYRFLHRHLNWPEPAATP